MISTAYSTMLKPFCLCLSLLLLSHCASQEPAAESATKTSPSPPESVVYVLGDLHGDLNAAKAAMALTGATNTAGEWTGQGLTVVQTGDLIDRGPEDRAVLDWFEQLAAEAPRHDSVLHLLNGNHEIMNVEGDFRYIHPDSMAAFSDLADASRSEQLGIADAPLAVQGRANAFAPGGRYAQQLAKRPAVLVLGDTLFVHGGILPEHVTYGLEQINTDYEQHLEKGTPLPAILQPSDTSPLWTRIYSQPAQAADCVSLQAVLTRLKLQRMVVAHSVHPHINSACNDQVWRIDTGMSKAYQGRIEVLKLQGNSARVLTPDSP